MKKIRLAQAFLLIFLVGCSTVFEPFKMVLGISTRALEDARVNALSQSYECSYHDCYNAVLALGTNSKEVPVNPKYYHVFQKSWKKGFIIVMGIEGQVDTTEVGIFFGNDHNYYTTVDISSLSTTAKQKVAKVVFQELDEKYLIINK